jgi:2-methylcitrate dehydratase
MLAALLAEKGYTGPGHLIEGKEGLLHCFGPEWKLSILTNGLGESWRISQCGMKAFPSEALTHAPISATIDLIKSHNLLPGNISKVQIHTLARAADILSDPSKYDPQTKETADHSLPFVIAVALVDRQVTPLSFTPEKIADSTVRAQLRKVELIADPEIDKVFPQLQRTVVKITTCAGQQFTKQLDYPKGDPRNPLSDREVEEKFAALADGVISPSAQKKLKDAIWNLDRIKSVTDLMAMTKASRAGSKKSAQTRPTKKFASLSAR